MLKTCWTVFNPIQAYRRQCNSIALALGLTPIEKTVTIKAPWKWLPCSWQRLDSLMFQLPHNKIAAPWPDLLIASGKNVIPVALNIKRRSKGRTRIIFVQAPANAKHQFDLIIAPAHDDCRGDNVIETMGAAHDLTQELISTEAIKLRQRISQHQGPFLSILLGGTHKGYTLTAQRSAHLASQIEMIAENFDGTVLITGSRRTGQDNLKYLLNRFKGKTNIWIHDGSGQNPYIGMLGISKAIMVTDDSISMISEACFTGKPTYLLHLPNCKPRAKNIRFISHCIQNGYIREYNGRIENWAYTPLDEAARIAPLIRKKLNIA